VFPSRAQRWVIGLTVTGLLAVLGLASLAANSAAFAERETDERNAVTYRAYTGRADGVVVETRYESVTSQSRRVSVAVAYTPAGGDRLVNWITVHAWLGPFYAGEAFEVAYDPARPERAASGMEADVLARHPRGLERLVGENGYRAPAPTYRSALITEVLAVLALAVTVVWATRSPRRVRSPR
jgi:hypothetical protein